MKFMIFEEAGNAIRALNGHYIFPGVSSLVSGEHLQNHITLSVLFLY